MTETCPRPTPSPGMVKMLTDHTFTTSRSFGLSWRYLTIHVMTLAVVSWAANSTPIMLSAIWSSLKVSPLSSLEFNRQPKRSLSSNFFSFLSQIITLRILVSLFLACRVPNKTEKGRRQSIGMSLCQYYYVHTRRSNGRGFSVIRLRVHLPRQPKIRDP